MTRKWNCENVDEGKEEGNKHKDFIIVFCGFLNDDVGTLDYEMQDHLRNVNLEIREKKR
jgi:hypothetical protein